MLFPTSQVVDCVNKCSFCHQNIDEKLRHFWGTVASIIQRVLPPAAGIELYGKEIKCKKTFI